MSAVDLKLWLPRPTVPPETDARITAARGAGREAAHSGASAAGRIREQLGEYAAAEAAYRTGLGQNPADPFLLLHLGAIRATQGDSWEARKLLRAYDELSWTHPRYRTDFAAARHTLMNELAR